MFTRILQWIKGVFFKMIGQSNVKQALHVDVAISSEMANALQLWASMYQNQAPWLNNDIKSLNLPASIAGEIARAVTIEMKVQISGSPRAEYLANQFKKILPKIRQMVEYGSAKGGLMFKPFVNGKGIDVDYIQADQFYPVSFDANGNITSCVFADQRQVGNDYFTRLEYHAMSEVGCEIRNLAFKSTTKDQLGNSVLLTTMDAWKDLQQEALITGIDKPLFAYFKFPLANNIDPTSPLGVSCFSRAVDLIKEADEIWSNLIWEFDSGKRAIYVDTLAFGKDKNGKPTLPNSRLYRPLNNSGNVNDEDLFKDWSPEFREASILSGLDAVLKKIEYTCGLAYGTFSDPQVESKTATEIKISKQRTYSTIKDTQKSLQTALEQLLYAMDVWATLSTLSPKGTFKANYDFDDSVIVDKELQMSQDRQTVSMGGMPIYVFLMRNYGLDEETAKKWVAEKQGEAPMDLFPGT